jgi:hypothetical protein
MFCLVDIVNFKIIIKFLCIKIYKKYNLNSTITKGNKMKIENLK